MGPVQPLPDLTPSQWAALLEAAERLAEKHTRTTTEETP